MHSCTAQPAQRAFKGLRRLQSPLHQPDKGKPVSNRYAALRENAVTFTFFELEKEECSHSLVNIQKTSLSNPLDALNPTSPAVICVFNYSVSAAGTRWVLGLDIKMPSAVETHDSRLFV